MSKVTQYIREQLTAHIEVELERLVREGEINNLDQAFEFVESMYIKYDMEYDDAGLTENEIESIVAYVVRKVA